MLEGVRGRSDGESLTVSIGFDISSRLTTGFDYMFCYWQIRVFVFRRASKEILLMLR